MKKAIVFAVLATCASTSYADTYVQGYTKSNGTYVQGHYRSDSNHTTSDNYSTRGNTNPYTGEKGTKPNYRPGYNNSYNSKH